MFVPHTSEAPDLPLVETPQQPIPPAVFLYDQRNQDYLDGRIKSPYLKESNGSTFKQILVMLLMGFAIILIYSSVMSVMRWILINTAGATTFANLIDLTKTRMSRDTDIFVYTATLNYTVDGKTYQLIQHVSEEIYMSLTTTAVVRYWPPNPTFAGLEGVAESRHQLAETLYQLFFPGIPATVVLIGGIVALRNMRRAQATQRQFEGDSKIIYGEVHNVREVPRVGREYVLRIRYTFRAPSGNLLTREQEGPMNERRGQPLPTKGTPVAVLYLDTKHIEML